MGVAYVIAEPSEYLVVTGLAIKDIKLTKKTWRLPMRQIRRFDMSPKNYTFEVQAMSSEKLAFTLPAVFTIGPRDEPAALRRYALLIANAGHGNHVTDLIKGVVEGETRVLAAGMSMENVFQDTRQFKQEVFSKVQVELNQFGLHIYNANIKQLVDVPGLEYFSYFGKSKQQEAANKAKVDVAEANYRGNTGQKEREGLTMQAAAKVDAETAMISKKQTMQARQMEIRLESETKIYQNQREAEVAEANANLGMQKSSWQQQTKIAEIEAVRNASIRDAELARALEQKKGLAETERLRGQALAKATVDYEISVQTANSNLNHKQREADAVLYLRRKHAEALQVEADSELYSKRKEAEGIVALGEAQATYAKSMVDAFDGNFSSLREYLMIDRKVYQDLGEINARAIQGLEPKMSIWTTGGGGGDGNNGQNSGSAAQPIADIYRMLPPLLNTIHEQTGMSSSDFPKPTINFFSNPPRSPAPPFVTDMQHSDGQHHSSDGHRQHQSSDGHHQSEGHN